MLLLLKKHTDTMIEQTKTRPQETLEFKMNKQMNKQMNKLFRSLHQLIYLNKVNSY